MKKIIIYLGLILTSSFSSISYAWGPFISMDIPKTHPLVAGIERDLKFENQFLMTRMNNSSISLEKGQFIEAKIKGLQDEMNKAFDNKTQSISENKLEHFKLEELAIRQDLGLDIHQDQGGKN
jgi:hypothetical protein